MTNWAIYALVVLVGPLLLIVRWLVAGKLRERRRLRLHTKHPEDLHSVAAIRARVEQERADAAVQWPQADPDDTVVLPVAPTEPDEPDEAETLPDNVLPFVPRLPVRRRPYVDKPSPWPRPPAPEPDFELLQRLRDGLDRL